MPQTTVKLAMGQMLVEGGQLGENLRRAVETSRNTEPGRTAARNPIQSPRGGVPGA